MAIVLEIACRAMRGHADNARNWYENEAVPAWSALPGLTAFDLYVPAAGVARRTPWSMTVPGPLFLMMLEFSNMAALEQAARSQNFAAPLSKLPGGLDLIGRCDGAALLPGIR